MRLRAVAALALLGGLCLVLPALVRAQPPSADPTGIVENYEAARNRHDVDGALALFSDDAVVTDRTQRVYAGKDAIRRFLEQGGTRLRAVSVVDRQVVGNHVTWTERLSSQSFNASFQVEAVVQSGQIKLMSYVPAGQAARAAIPETVDNPLPAALGFGAVMFMLAGALTLVATGAPRPPVGGSQLRGQLVSGLKAWSAQRSPALRATPRNLPIDRAA
jgi:hypothetical protein